MEGPFWWTDQFKEYVNISLNWGNEFDPLVQIENEVDDSLFSFYLKTLVCRCWSLSLSLPHFCHARSFSSSSCVVATGEFPSSSFFSSDSYYLCITKTDIRWWLVNNQIHWFRHQHLNINKSQTFLDQRSESLFKFKKTMKCCEKVKP